MMKEKYKTFDCEYMKISKDPRYLYIHLSTTHGWGIGGGKDIVSGKVSTITGKCQLVQKTTVNQNQEKTMTNDSYDR